MNGLGTTVSKIGNSIAFRSRRRDTIEIAIAYGLILAAIWTPRYLQVLLWCGLAAFVAAVTFLSSDGPESMGLRSANPIRSFWIVGLALAIAAVAVAYAVGWNTLRIPGGPILFIQHFWGYTLWAATQQFLLQCFLLSRLLRLLPDSRLAAVAAALMFAFTHLPNTILTPVTLICGLAACMLFLRYRNIYPLALAHAILGIAIAITIPGPVDHNMRVGLDYLNYARDTASFSEP
jgi:hypothetical protein